MSAPSTAAIASAAAVGVAATNAAPPPITGPLAHATLLVGAAAPVIAAYRALGLKVVADGPVATAQAQAWGQAALGGQRCVELAPRDGTSLLRLIEVPGAQPRPTRWGHGWLALEILVADVDALQGPARAAGFEIVGPPADLEMSSALRAMQVVGPAGEMLYLTQVKAPVPPFDLPLSAELAPGQALGPLFIAVMSTPSRAAALQACADRLDLPTGGTLQFDTKVTVLNRAFGRPFDSRWPLATVALGGHCLFEIDEVVDPKVWTPSPGSALPSGLAWVSAFSAAAGPCNAALLELSPGAWFEQLAPTHQKRYSTPTRP